MNYIIAYLERYLHAIFNCRPNDDRIEHSLFVHADLSPNLQHEMKYLHHLFISHNRVPRTIVGIGVSEYPYMYKWSP